MKSPFTGGEVVLKREPQKLTYRGKEYDFIFTYYECIDTKEQFTTEELDETNMGQIYNQYRSENGIPFPDEIKELRDSFGLSAKSMAMILGFGENQYRLYENGEVPSLSNGRAIRAIIDSPSIIHSYVEAARGEMTESEYCKVMKKIESSGCNSQTDTAFVEWIYTNTKRGIYNGYAKLSPDVLKNTILFFINRFGGVFRTQLNKLLFYADFVSYRELGMSVTGLQYNAIKYGPVPVRWDRVYSSFNDIYPQPTDTGNGNIRNKLVSQTPCDTSVFTDRQLNILNSVYEKFKGLSSREISEISHQEQAWQTHINANEPINFKHAFFIHAI